MRMCQLNFTSESFFLVNHIEKSHTSTLIPHFGLMFDKNQTRSYVYVFPD
jgi:hypothetical protein